MLRPDPVAAIVLFAVISPCLIFCQEIPNLKPGDDAPSFVIQAKDALVGSNGVSLKYGTANDSNIEGPIMFLAYTDRSAFLERLLSDPDCVKELFDYSPDNTNYIFLFYETSSSTVDATGVELAKKFRSAMDDYYWKRSQKKSIMPSRERRFPGSWSKVLKKTFLKSWYSRTYFATFPISTLGNWIPRVLSQWYCSGRGCGFDQIVVENAKGEILQVSKRLDARYDWLPSPTSLAKYGHLLVVSVGDACDSNMFVNVSGDYLALVSMNGTKCSYFTKVQNCEKNGARAVLVFASPSQALVDMNCNGRECNTQLSIPASMIPYVLGYEMSRGYIDIYVRFQTTPSDTFVFGIDGQGKVAETDWFLYPSIRFLSFQAQWFNYKTQLLKNLTTEDAMVINVFNQTTLQGNEGVTATITLPSIDVLQRYEYVELDFSLFYPRSRGDACPHREHMIQLYVCCNVSSALCGQELGRWITPFRRPIGHWLTPVKPLIPLLQSAGSSSNNTCDFTLKTFPSATAWVPSLNIRLVNKVQVLPQYKTFHSMDKTLVPFEIVPLFQGETFDKNYNSKYEPFTFVWPSDTKKVKLVATITGQGSDNNKCTEFCVTSHHFIVNKQNYSRVYKNAGTAMGCTERLSEGVVPNEHDTWLYGRDGWCDGQEVIPWVVDITSALKATNNTIEYFGRFNNTDPNPTGDPGTIIMYSYLVYYKYLKPYKRFVYTNTVKPRV